MAMVKYITTGFITQFDALTDSIIVVKVKFYHNLDTPIKESHRKRFINIEERSRI